MVSVTFNFTFVLKNCNSLKESLKYYDPTFRSRKIYAFYLEIFHKEMTSFRNLFTAGNYNVETTEIFYLPLWFSVRYYVVEKCIQKLLFPVPSRKPDQDHGNQVLMHIRYLQ